MKSIAIGILLFILVSFLIQPMVEIANVAREKVILGSALSNACRAAKNTSLKYESIRDLHAQVDQNLFMQNFTETFEKAMNAAFKERSGNVVTFSSLDERYSEFKVILDFEEEESSTGQIITKVNVKAEADYNFKTRYLKIANDSRKDLDYKLTAERNLLLTVRN